MKKPNTNLSYFDAKCRNSIMMFNDKLTFLGHDYKDDSHKYESKTQQKYTKFISKSFNEYS